MPLQVRKFTAQTQETTLKVDEDTVELTFYPKRYTPALVADLQAVMGNAVIKDGKVVSAELTPDGVAGLTRIVCRLVAKWGLMDGEAMYPLTLEAVGELPIIFLAEVIGTIQEALDMDPTPAGTPSAS